ncbi:phytanoyl-CoA dioxygenase family protein [Rhodospirillum sp. A1_3_36]|uniref:phytanoyl-CoA dioxygenase family protein n=1 Tax=Rhodospirillum sp. A1_3_36 TaxID=3391666 RepID=UPI0039A3FF73
MAEDFAPSEADILFYEAHGWWLAPPFLSDSLIDTLRYGVDRLLAGEVDQPLAVDIGDGLRPEGITQIDYVSLRIQEFMEVMVESPVGRIAAALARTPSVRLFHDQLVVKPPLGSTRSSDRTGRVGWHTDKAYWTTCRSNDMITAWIPLEDVTEENGTLAVWDGSHRWPEVERLHTFGDGDLEAVERAYRDRGLLPEIRLLPMGRGQVSFHHCRLVHGGYANRTDQPRVAYAIHMQDEANRFVRDRAGRGGHVNDLLCARTPEDLPDYTDPAVFPQLWPKAN